MNKMLLSAGCLALVLLGAIVLLGPFDVAVEPVTLPGGGAPAGIPEEYARWIDDLAEDEVLVLGNESMPFCGRENAQDVGLAVDILEAVTAAGGPRFRYRLGLPWKRAQVLVHQEPGAPIAIIPLTRTATREANYVWISELIPHALHLHTFQWPSPLQTMDEAKDLKLGIIRGSALIPLLKQQGFSQLKEVRNAETSARMLVAGRFDVMVESQWVNTYVWRSIGQDVAELQIGPRVGEIHHIYLGANPGFPAAITAKIRDAMGHVRSSGQLDEIYTKWREHRR